MAGRVQFVVSEKFFVLLLLAAGLIGGGYYWYLRQQQERQAFAEYQQHFRTPPYFVNRGVTVMRSCRQCLASGKLKPQTAWQIAAPQEIPATEQHWFVAVEDPPLPVTVAGVLMLPVHPSFQEDPSFGFDQSRVVLVLFQNLQQKSQIEAPPPPVPEPTPAPSTEPDLPQLSREERIARGNALGKALRDPYMGNWKNADPYTNRVTRFSITGNLDKFVVHAWGKCNPNDCDWHEVQATPTGQVLSVFWDQPSGTRRWEISLTNDGRLFLSEHNYYDGSDHYTTDFFIRSADGQQ